MLSFKWPLKFCDTDHKYLLLTLRSESPVICEICSESVCLKQLYAESCHVSTWQHLTKIWSGVKFWWAGVSY